MRHGVGIVKHVVTMQGENMEFVEFVESIQNFRYKLLIGQSAMAPAEVQVCVKVCVESAKSINSFYYASAHSTYCYWKFDMSSSSFVVAEPSLDT